MRLFWPVVMSLAAALSAGCYQIDQKIALNPDGSARITFDIVYSDPLFGIGEPDAKREAALKKSVFDLLSKAEGIEAWSGLRYEITEEGKYRIRGLAYAADISDVKLPNMDLVGWKISPLPEGRTVIEMRFGGAEAKERSSKENTAEAPAPADVEKLVAKQKSEWIQTRALLGMVLAEVSVQSEITGPGRIVEARNVEPSDGVARVRFSGADYLAALDRIVGDEAFLREQIVRGAPTAPDDTNVLPRVNELLYGEKGPVRVVFEDGPPTFDYAADVEKARLEFETFLAFLKSELSNGPAAGMPAARGEEFASIKVGAIRYDFNDINAWMSNIGTTVTVVGDFRGSVLDVVGGTVTRVIADNGKDLTPVDRRRAEIDGFALSDDRSRVGFPLQFGLPPETAQGYREIAGTIRYRSSSGTKEVNFDEISFMPAS